MAREDLSIEAAGHEIVLTRVFHAPREQVFAVAQDPSLVSRWWGPRRYSTTVDQMDVRPGGLWRFVHHDAEGNEFGFKGVYHDIVWPERVVCTFEFEGMPGHVALQTTTFEEHNGKTIMREKSVFQSVADREGMLQSGMAEGAAETLDRFEELLATV